MKFLFNLFFKTLGLIFIFFGLYALISVWQEEIYIGNLEYIIKQMYNLLKIITGALLYRIGSNDVWKILKKLFVINNDDY